MTKKQNCWEFKKCGREPGGKKVGEFGLCPATVEERADGINSGKMGGRICWAVSGSHCRGEVQGIFAAKITSCASCAFFQTVDREEDGILEQTEKFLARTDKDKVPKI